MSSRWIEKQHTKNNLGLDWENNWENNLGILVLAMGGGVEQEK